MLKAVILAAYILELSIYPELERVKPDEESGETSLIPAIQSLIDKGGRVYAVELQRQEKRRCELSLKTV